MCSTTIIQYMVPSDHQPVPSFYLATTTTDDEDETTLKAFHNLWFQSHVLFLSYYTYSFYCCCCSKLSHQTALTRSRPSLKTFNTSSCQTLKIPRRSYESNTVTGTWWSSFFLSFFLSSFKQSMQRENDIYTMYVVVHTHGDCWPLRTLTSFWERSHQTCSEKEKKAFQTCMSFSYSSSLPFQDDNFKYANWPYWPRQKQYQKVSSWPVAVAVVASQVSTLIIEREERDAKFHTITCPHTLKPYFKQPNQRSLPSYETLIVESWILGECDLVLSSRSNLGWVAGRRAVQPFIIYTADRSCYFSYGTYTSQPVFKYK